MSEWFAHLTFRPPCQLETSFFKGTCKCTKFDVCQVMGSQDIDWKTLDLPVDV